MSVTSSKVYGNWSRPTSPGLWKLGLFGTGWMFAGAIITMVTAIVSYLVAIVFLGFVFISLVPVVQVDRYGRNVYVRVWEHVQWVIHRRSGRNVYLGGPLSVSPTEKSELPGLAAQLSVTESIDAVGRRFVVVYQPSVGHITTVLDLSPAGDTLIDAQQIDQQVAAYGQWLANLGYEEGLVGVSVTVETAPDTGVRLRETIAERVVADAPALAVKTLEEIVETFPAGSADTTYRLALTWSRKRGTRRLKMTDVVEEIAIRLPDLTAGLANTGAGSIRPLTKSGLAKSIRTSFDPSIAKDLESYPDELEWSETGPIHAQENKDHYLHDGVASISWVMGLAPRGAISSSLMKRLLQPHRDVPKKRVTIMYRPYDPAKAAKLVEDDVTNAHFLANQQNRASARDIRELRSVEKSATEEAAGAGLTRFAMIVTATCDEADLDRTQSVVEFMGRHARIDLRRAVRSQATTFIAGLPLGIILPSHVRLPGDWKENV